MVNHHILLQRLETSGGIRGNPLLWLKSCLCFTLRSCRFILRCSFFYKYNVTDIADKFTERGSEYEFPQRQGESNLADAGLGNYIEVVESEYDQPDDMRRRLPSVPSDYEELRSHANGHAIPQTGESSLQEAGLENVVFVDDADYDYPD